MRVLKPTLNLVVAAAICTGVSAHAQTAPSEPLRPPAQAQPVDPAVQGEEVDELLSRLADPDLRHWQQIERDIIRIWSRSGSQAMDLLLRRGRTALLEGDIDTALEHLTALTDHAPDFAEGWFTRARAYSEAERYGLAMADLQRALAHNPRHFGALTGVGTIFEQLGDLEQAHDAFAAAHEIHPHRPRIKAALERLRHDVQGRNI